VNIALTLLLKNTIIRVVWGFDVADIIAKVQKTVLSCCELKLVELDSIIDIYFAYYLKIVS